MCCAWSYFNHHSIITQSKAYISSLRCKFWTLKIKIFPLNSVSVFAPVRYRVVKITCSYNEVILQTMKNYQAHYGLSWFRPLP
jgi:hypothetical protein